MGVKKGNKDDKELHKRQLSKEEAQKRREGFHPNLRGGGVAFSCKVMHISGQSLKKPQQPCERNLVRREKPAARLPLNF